MSRPRPGTEAVIADVRAIARDHGYAIGVHGSLVRDLDLIAVPWTAKAKAASTLVRALDDGLPDHFLKPGFTPQKPQARKPHGRLGWTFLRIGPRGPSYIDLSVVPRA